MKLPLQPLYHWYRDALRNPKYRWWIVLGTLAYLINPVDISPDFLPILGEVDDIALVTLLVAEVSQIVMDKVKQRQSGGSQPSNTAANGAAGSPVTNTVEVEAVSVQE